MAISKTPNGTGHDSDPKPEMYKIQEDLELGDAKKLRVDEGVDDGQTIVVKTENEDVTSTSDICRPDGAQDSTGPIDSDGRVWWDGENDPENPYNWPSWRKITNSVLISLLTLMTPLASSVFSPAVPELMKEFKSSNQELAAFVVSVYVLGFAIGPLILAPLSEMYGRYWLYNISNIGFVIFSVACALAPSLDSLIVFRFFAGCFGSTPMTNGGGSIADMFPPEQRAGVMAAFSVGPLLGPIIGPVVGGVLSEKKGWKWVFWVLAIISGVMALASFFLMKETYAPAILKKKTKRLRKETGNESLRSKLESNIPKKELFKRAILRPARLLIFSPICTIFAVYIMVVYGYLYLLFCSIPFVFQKSYGFSASITGLVYLGLGVGCLIGMAIFSIDSAIAMKRHKETGEPLKPEIRMRLLPFSAVIFPVGFFLYGWTTQYEVHWIVPIIALAIIGIGNLGIFMAVSVYLVDAYEQYAASALAANTVMRSIAGALLPLCALDMYDKLGMGWGNSLLGFLALALVPIPFFIKRYGEKLRNSFDMNSI
ncbi:hypothetical protein V2G26_001962 [Clonostachys chloroleuca]